MSAIRSKKNRPGSGFSKSDALRHLVLRTLPSGAEKPGDACYKPKGQRERIEEETGQISTKGGLELCVEAVRAWATEHDVSLLLDKVPAYVAQEGAPGFREWQACDERLRSIRAELVQKSITKLRLENEVRQRHQSAMAAAMADHAAAVIAPPCAPPPQPLNLAPITAGSSGFRFAALGQSSGVSAAGAAVGATAGAASSASGAAASSGASAVEDFDLPELTEAELEELNLILPGEAEQMGWSPDFPSPLGSGTDGPDDDED